MLDDVSLHFGLPKTLSEHGFYKYQDFQADLGFDAFGTNTSLPPTPRRQGLLLGHSNPRNKLD